MVFCSGNECVVKIVMNGAASHLLVASPCCAWLDNGEGFMKATNTGLIPLTSLVFRPSMKQPHALRFLLLTPRV